MPKKSILLESENQRINNRNLQKRLSQELYLDTLARNICADALSLGTITGKEYVALNARFGRCV